MPMLHPSLPMPRSSRRLVISQISTFANYEYALYCEHVGAAPPLCACMQVLQRRVIPSAPALHPVL
jgi:hypothetical protein